MKKKRKYLYYLGLQHSTFENSKVKHVEVEREKMIDVDVEYLKDNYAFAYMMEIPDWDGWVKYNPHIDIRGILKYKKLSALLQDFVLSLDFEVEVEKRKKQEFYKDESENFIYRDIVDDRLDKICDEYFVVRQDVKTKKVTIIDDDTIRNCFELMMNPPETPFKFQDFTSEKIKLANTDYYGIFTEQLKKCFGKNKSGIITLMTEDYGARFDVIKNKDGFSFGVEESHDKMLKARLANMFQDISSCTLRVFTDEIVDKIPVKEIYAFVLLPDFSIKNIPYTEVKESHIKNNSTGEDLPPEKNVVYCDIYNNRLCSDDIE